MSKVLITSGCSFSEVLPRKDTWPNFLFSKLKAHGYTQHLTSAMSSQGNGLISRGIQYHVLKALESYNPEDILVGVMWSNRNRFDYRCEDPNLLSWGEVNKHRWTTNPRSIVNNVPKQWVMGNHHWDSIEFSTYYKFYYSDIGAAIISLEHILRTQYFLKNKGIKYFFTNFIDNNIIPEKEKFNIELKYLIDELDENYYLPVTSEHRWLVLNSKDKEQFIKDHKHGTNSWIHPKSQHHEEFVNEVIYPWIQEKGYVV